MTKSNGAGPAMVSRLKHVRGSCCTDRVRSDNLNVGVLRVLHDGASVQSAVSSKPLDSLSKCCVAKKIEVKLWWVR